MRKRNWSKHPDEPRFLNTVEKIVLTICVLGLIALCLSV